MRSIHRDGKTMSISKMLFLASVPLLAAWHLVGRVQAPALGLEDRGKPTTGAGAFLGIWRGGSHGQPAVTLMLKNIGNELAGAVMFYFYRDEKLAVKDEVQLLAPKLQADILSFSLREPQTCGTCHATRRERGLVRDPQYGEVLQFQMRLVSEDQAQLETLGVAETEFSLVRLTQRK